MISSEERAVIIDNGSGFCKAGLSGDDCPLSIFKNIIGKPKFPFQGNDMPNYIGDEVLKIKYPLELCYPIQNGIITNFDYIETLWHHCFYSELNVAPDEQPFLLIESIQNSKRNREKIISIMFEKFEVPQTYLMDSAPLSLYAYGKTMGLVVDSGHGVTKAVPVFEGQSLPQGIHQSTLSGGDITKQLFKLFQNQLYFNEKQLSIILQEIKEKYCYIVEDFEEYIRLYTGSAGGNRDVQFKLPDGNKILLKDELFRASEIIFKGKKGIQELVYKSIHSSDIDLRKQLSSSIVSLLLLNIKFKVLSGGTTMIEGIEQRLIHELKAKENHGLKIKIHSLSDRKYLAWIGASQLTQLSSFLSLWINKEEYEEIGSSIVHRKCF